MPNLQDKKYYQYLIVSFSGVLCRVNPIQNGKEKQIQFIQEAYQNHPFIQAPTKDQIIAKMNAGVGIPDIFKQFNSDNANTLLTAYRKHSDDDLITRMALTENADILLARLKDAGIKIIIVDFRTPDIVKKGIDKLNIGTYIDSVIDTHPSGEFRKGQPKVFKLIQEAYPEITTDNTAILGHQNADLNFANKVEDKNGLIGKLVSFWFQNAGGDFEMCSDLAKHYTVQENLDFLNLILLSPQEDITPTPSSRP